MQKRDMKTLELLSEKLYNGGSLTKEEHKELKNLTNQWETEQAVGRRHEYLYGNC